MENFKSIFNEPVYLLYSLEDNIMFGVAKSLDQSEVMIKDYANYSELVNKKEELLEDGEYHAKYVFKDNVLFVKETTFGIVDRFD